MAPRDRRAGKESRTQNAPAEAGSVRLNKYFVPRDGIEREVITSDICRYLGNDALVRPGNYENPQTGKSQQGYFIEARKNLTAEMIADLKADSERWLVERKYTVQYRVSTTHQSRGYFGWTSESSTVPAQSDGDVYKVPGPDIESSSDFSDGVADLSIERSPKYGERPSLSATRTHPTPSIEIGGTSYGADLASFMSPEDARRPGFEVQPTINRYGTQTHLCKLAGRPTITESIKKAITPETINTVSSVSVGSAYYTSRQANAQNEAKPAWEREEADKRERLSEREAANERQEQGLREWETALVARERTLQVDLRELDHRAQRREEAITKKEVELEKRSKEYGDWGQELHKVEAKILRTENELKERGEELRRDAVKLREREDELNGKEKEQVEREKKLKKIDAGITRMEIGVTQRSEELRAREEELKRQNQQCNCRHQDTESASTINSRPSSTIGDEPAMSTSSVTPAETSSWTRLPRMEQECNHRDSSPSLADENSAPNPQSTSVPTSMVNQSSSGATKTSSQIITTYTEDTESPISSATLAPSKPALSEIKAQLSIDKKLDLPDRSISKNVKT